MAIFTCVIMSYARRAHKLSVELKKANERIQDQEDKFKQQVSDLYRAIVISNLIEHDSAHKFKYYKGLFRTQYKGKTPIFSDDPDPQ